MGGFDNNIICWILEYLVRLQPVVSSGTVAGLLDALPPLKSEPRLKRCLLLRKIECDASSDTLSETTLESMEKLEEEDGEMMTVRWMRAYCGVAASCWLDYLKDGGHQNPSKKAQAFRVWKLRIERIGNIRMAGSEELKEKMKAAALDCSACAWLSEWVQGVNPAEAVCDFVREEKERMGPSFLESLAATLKRDKVLKRKLGIISDDDHDVLESEKSVGAGGGVPSRSDHQSPSPERKRRKPRKWSSSEEAALIEGVNK